MNMLSKIKTINLKKDFSFSEKLTPRSIPITVPTSSFFFAFESSLAKVIVAKITTIRVIDLNMIVLIN
jgi:hypothetical protein